MPKSATNPIYGTYIKHATKFIARQMQEKQAQRLIVGLSGGIDSAVVARLCQIALQGSAKDLKSTNNAKDRLLCVFLPSSKTDKSSFVDVKALVEKFSLPFIQHPIAKYDSLFSAQFVDSSALEVGNFCARVRMALLYHHSSMYQGIVVGTSNQSELLLGYGTIFGDLACAINPIGALFKTQIFSLARILQIPESIITKPPSADLYPNQSDEGELGFSYASIDSLLIAIVKKSAKYQGAKHQPIPSTIHPKALHKKHYKNFDEKLVSMVLTRIKANQFKREMPTIFLPSPKLLRELRTDTSSHKATHKGT